MDQNPLASSFKFGARENRMNRRKTKEIIEDTLLADYNGDGELLGIEVLAPVRLADLTKQVDQPRRNSFRKFVRRSAPATLVYA